ncbi:MAG: ribosome small subunit-dependent GTPase A [Deltaproteobacteria bacterium]|nr:ribosome small subunit-dependent GTPase A [Deltaproteobacteria bacterium]
MAIFDLQHLGWGPFFEEQCPMLPDARLTVARIAAAHRGRYELWSAKGSRMGRRTGRLRYAASEIIYDPDAKGTPAVGDWVGARWPENPDELASVEHLFTRRTAFLRRAAGFRSVPQVVAANINTVFVVCGLDGDFNERRIERYLTQLAESGAEPVLVLTKADLAADAEERAAAQREKLGRAVYLTILKPGAEGAGGEGIESLRAYTRIGHTVAFVGSSGAGKSSLVNALVGRDVQAVGEVRASDDHGRHTTVHRQLVELAGGGLLLDNPGIREIQLWGEHDGVDETFEDIAKLAGGCRFRDCQHADEPDCAVLAAVEDGTLTKERIEHYKALLAEQERQAKRRDEYARLHSHRVAQRKRSGKRKKR